ncbi:MAG: hypothetical protein R6U85_05155 [Salinivirgaceae bacterium]
MKRKLLILPFMLLGAFLFFNYGCEEDKDEDDMCQAFNAVPEQCEIPTICCPTDGGDCYYVNPDGGDYYCDAALDSEDNPDGCNTAMDNYMNDHCSKMTKSEMVSVKADLSAFTKQLMEKARFQSVCM